IYLSNKLQLTIIDLVMTFTDKTAHSLEVIFNPRSVAIVGATSKPNKQGYLYIKYLLNFGFNGKLYLVNLRGGEIMGIKVYPSLSDIPETVDYVISVIPAKRVPRLIQECTAKGVKVLHLYTAQLSETGIPERIQLEKHITALARQAGIRLLGPNCMGVYYPKNGMTFRYDSPKTQGEVAFISQSAGHAAEVMSRGKQRGLTFSKMVSYGNAADINETELFDYLGNDPETKIIIAYIEGIKSPDFPKVLRAVAKRKPVIILKAGRTEAGARAASTHTGSIAGSYVIWQGLMKQCRVISVTSIDELIDMAIAFSKLPLPKSKNVGVIGSGGGGSIMAADEFELHGLKTPPIPQETLKEIEALIGDDWMLIKNPIDTSVVIPAGWSLKEIKQIFLLLAEHPLYQILVADAGEWRPESPEDINFYRRLVGLLLEVRQSTKKPMAIVLRNADHSEEWKWRTFIEQRQRSIREGVAIFPTVARAARALGALVYYYLGNSV
ncbi:CoA-binding protein, partial [Chloroflexota bacterium]